MDQKSIFVLAHGLKLTTSLLNLNVEGNPIGPQGMRFLIQAMSSNTHTSFKVNMKEISADKDIKTYKNVFDTTSPEKEYSLNMVETYNQLILQNLLRIAEGAANVSEGKFDTKGCFYSVKLNGKANWNPPVSKDINGLFDPIDKTGLLTFHFTTNPILFKQQQAKLAALEAAQPLGTILAKPAPVNIELLQIEYIDKPIISAQGFNRFVNMIATCYNDEDEQNQEELVRSLAREHMLWARQAL